MADKKEIAHRENPKPQAAVGESDFVRQGMIAFDNVRGDRDRLRALCDQYKAQADGWERAHAVVSAENELLRAQVKDNEHRTGFYMRHSMELLTNLSTVGDIIQTAINRAKDAAYRPTNAAPDREQPAQQPLRPGEGPKDDGQPMPKFLQGPQNGSSGGDITSTGKDGQ